MRLRPVVLLAALAAATVGCSEGSEPDDAAPAATPTTLAPAEFADAVRAGDLDAIGEVLADDVELYSPVLDEPFVGRDRVRRLFGVLLDILEDVKIREDIEAPGRFVLVFDARIGDQPIQVVDLLHFDDDGRVESFTITSRPLAGTQALAVAVAPHLPDIG